jgi:ubiquinol-cytochrome c reductase iron-sulfur subunit
MSDTNPPGRPGAGDSGDESWPEYLTGGESHEAGSSAAGAAGATPAAASAASSGSATPEGTYGPRRVIGTPAPAQSRVLLPEPGDTKVVVPELPPDVDDQVRAKKMEKVVAALFILAMLAGLAFLVLYSTIGVGSITDVLHSNLALGGSLSIVFLALGAGATLWVRHLMPEVERTEERHLMRSTDADRAAFEETFNEGAATSGFVKRPILRRTLIAATLPLGIAPLFLLRDTGPLPGTSLDTTVWRKGLRLIVYGTGRPVTAAEFNSPGSIISVVPEGYEDNDDALAKAAVVIIKFRPGELFFTNANHAVDKKVVANWTVDNIVAYSKICTHLGCPAALYEQTTHHILCPCHQSTFDATKGAQVIFGPATRPLPQLPIGVDSQGFLIATGPFQEPVGPTFWERG